MLTKDLAICIRAVDFSETSQIVTFFCKNNGKIDAIAKGSKRAKSAFDGPIEVFSFGNIVFSTAKEENLAVLTEFEQRPDFTRISNNLSALNCSLFAAELINQLTNEYDPHLQLFESFREFLQNTQDAKEKSEIIISLILFQLTLLREIGLQPILKCCVNCKNIFIRESSEIYFSSSANGLICRDCEASFTDKIKLSTSAWSCLINLKLITKAGEKTLKEIEKILIHHFTEIIGRPPKMAKYLLKL